MSRRVHSAPFRFAAAPPICRASQKKRPAWAGGVALYFDNFIRQGYQERLAAIATVTKRFWNA